MMHVLYLTIAGLLILLVCSMDPSSLREAPLLYDNVVSTLALCSLIALYK